MRPRTEHQILSSRNFERSSSTRSFVVISVSNARSQAALSLRSDSDGITVITRARIPTIHRAIQGSHDRLNGESTVKILAVMSSPSSSNARKFRISSVPHNGNECRAVLKVPLRSKREGSNRRELAAAQTFAHHGAFTLMMQGCAFPARAAISRHTLSSSVLARLHQLSG